MPLEKICRLCSKPFAPFSAAQKFCSECREKRVSSPVAQGAQQPPQPAPQPSGPDMAEEVRRLGLMFNAHKLRIENIERRLLFLGSEMVQARVDAKKQPPQPAAQPIPAPIVQQAAPVQPIAPTPPSLPKPTETLPDYSEYVELVERPAQAKPAPQPTINQRLVAEQAESERLRRLQGLADTLDKPNSPPIDPESSAAEISARLEAMAAQKQEAGGEESEKAARRKEKKRWSLNIFHR